MAVTKVTTEDVSKVLAEIIESVDDLRVTWYINDASRPPVAILSMPDIDYSDSGAGFCSARWDYTVLLVVSRNQDLAAQRLLSRYLSDVAQALTDAEPEELFSIEPLDASPTVATISGQELPGYNLRVVVRA